MCSDLIEGCCNEIYLRIDSNVIEICQDIKYKIQQNIITLLNKATTNQ